MQKIKIGFSRPRKSKIMSQLIKFWSNSKYSHVFSQFATQVNIECVYHAGNGMVHFKNLENFLKVNEIVKEYVIELTEEQHNKYLSLCINLAGEKYGYSELFKILVYDIFHTLGLSKKSHNGKGYICSELVGRLCVDILGMSFKKPTYLLTPKDIDIALEKRQKNG